MNEENETNETAAAEANTSASEARPRACPPWVKIVLGASLATNLIVAGLVGGWAMRDTPTPKRVDLAEGIDRHQARMLRLLPKERRDEARSLMLSSREEVEPHRMRVSEVHSRIINLMRANDFTPEDLRTMLDERRNVMTELNGMYSGQMVMIVSKMTPEERARMADRLERVVKRWSDHRVPR